MESKGGAAADVGLRNHVVNDDIQHRSGGKGERKRQYAARERYRKVAEKHAGDLDRTAYERNYCRAFFARSGFQKRRYYYHGLRNVLKRNAACHRYGVGEVSRSKLTPAAIPSGKWCIAMAATNKTRGGMPRHCRLSCPCLRQSRGPTMFMPLKKNARRRICPAA